MNVLRFRKKPVVIEAMQYTPESREAVIEWCGARYRFMDDDGCLQEWTYLGIQTLEGEMKACPGDWIIKGVEGEFYPCRPDIFEATYEPVGATRKRGQGMNCNCEPGRWECAYHAGWKDGYEAAQRERSANGLYYGADANMPRTTTQVQHFASETNRGRTRS